MFYIYFGGSLDCNDNIFHWYINLNGWLLNNNFYFVIIFSIEINFL